MAYLREAEENLEVSYPIGEIWETIPKALEELKWKVEEIDEANHKLKVKTRGALMSFPSAAYIELLKIDEKTTKLKIKVETPVTTITSVLDFGRSNERVSQFVVALARLMEKKHQQ